MTRMLQFIWPYVGVFPEDDHLKTDLEKIMKANCGSSASIYLDEARRLRDIESNRKSAAEAKSQIYLVALLAIIPILVSLTGTDAAFGKLDFTAWYDVAGFTSLAIGIAYGAGAFVNSFLALGVRAYNRIDVSDFVGATVNEESLIREILKSVRRDRRSINHKISYVIVVHRLIFRMAFSLILSLILVVLVPQILELFGALRQLVCG